MVEAHRLLRASREHVFAFIAHPEHLPRYGAPLWLSADTDPDGRRGGEALVTLRGYFAGLPVEAVLRTTSHPPQSLEIIQVRGTLRGFTQRFRIESDEEGTRLTCLVEADPGIAMISDEAAKHFLIQYVERMLDRLRLAAERRAPSRRPARPAAADKEEAAADATIGLAGEEITAPETPGSNRPPAEEPAAGALPVPEPGMTPPRGGAQRMPPPAHRPSPFRSPRPSRVRTGRGPGAGTGPASRPAGPAPPPQAPDVTAPAGNVGPASQAGAPDAGPSAQARRRRRRRRRRGRGPAGGAPDGGPAAGQ